MTDPLEAAAEALKNHPTLKLKYKSLTQRREIARVVVNAYLAAAMRAKPTSIADLGSEIDPRGLPVYRTST